MRFTKSFFQLTCASFLQNNITVCTTKKLKTNRFSVKLLMILGSLIVVSNTCSFAQSSYDTVKNSVISKYQSVVYGDAQYLNNLQIYDNISSFVKHANKYLTDNHNLQYYSQYKYAHNSWNLADGIYGSQIVNGLELGVYKQLHGLNFGMLAYNNNGSFHDDYANQDFAINLAHAKENTFGSLITLGATGENIYYSLSFLGGYQLFQFNRLVDHDQYITSKLQMFNLGVYSQLGKIAWEHKQQNIELLFGAMMLNHYLRAFDENNANSLRYQHWNGLNIFNIYSSLGVSYNIDFKIKQYQTHLSTNFTINHSLSEQNYNVTNEKLKDQQATLFNPSIIYAITIKNQTQIKPNFNVFESVVFNWFKGLLKYDIKLGVIYNF